MIYLKAFLVGGAICMVGQILVDRTKITPARIMVLFLVAGVVLSALGLYEPLVEFAGAGATTPISGFGHMLAKGVREAVEERGLLGALTGGLTAGAAEFRRRSFLDCSRRSSPNRRANRGGSPHSFNSVAAERASPFPERPSRCVSPVLLQIWEFFDTLLVACERKEDFYGIESGDDLPVFEYCDA